MQPQGFVSFIGAGPGDPELITVKGAKKLQQADLILYAGSLVPQAILPPNIPAIDTAPLTLQEIFTHMRNAACCGKNIARLHTGDPSLYGALREEIFLLTQANIAYEVIPGVTAACAAAACAGISFTVPKVTQTLIITRLEGKTPMPEKERIQELAKHTTSLAIYLSAAMGSKLEEALREVLPSETPVLIAHRVGFPQQHIVRTTLINLAKTLESKHLEKQSVILVLPGERAPETSSCLYDANFTHTYRPQTLSNS